ncbi:MAG: hypothetical protein K2I46_01680, partial [Clostridia bacterium]|nr:hypothetical protein [Clostridia bacterium]
TYNYTSGSVNTSDFDDGNVAKEGFALLFGGIAGRNAGKITFITAQYTGFDATMKVTAQNGSGLSKKRAHSRISAGGISGTMYSNKSEISNIIIMGRTSSFSLSGTASQNTGTNARAQIFMFGGAVVASNSAYSRAEGGIGQAVGTQGLVNNIITDFDVTWNGLGISGSTLTDQGTVHAPTEASNNAVVYCGKAYNVTILNMKRDNWVTNQHVDYQTDHCNCGVSGNSGENHETGYGNVVHTGDYSKVTVGIDADGSQIINVVPKDTVNSIIGEVKFTKYTGRGSDGTSDQVESGVADSASYPSNPPNNGSKYIYGEVENRLNYTFKIPAYQDNSKKFWEFEVYSYQFATISENSSAEGWSKDYIYNGSDYLLNQLKFTTKISGTSGVVNPVGLYAVATDNGDVITSGRLPGEYSINLQEKQAGLSYIDTVNKVVALAEDTADDTYTFTVKNAQMQIKNYTAEWLANNWLNEKTDFEFELINGLEGSADGYVYEVNGSEYRRTGLTITNDTSTKSRTYTVYLTSGGVQVTDPITYTVKVDLENPILSIPKYEHPADIYYTHNRISIDAQDEHSGVGSLWLYSYNKTTGELEHSYNIIEECNASGGSNDLSYIDKDTGNYVWWFRDTGRKVIEVTDNAGRKTSIELNVKIDTFNPTISVDAYYMADVPGLDANQQPIITPTKTPYEGGKVEKAVYFDATAQFGESGGEIQYSYDNEQWYTYTGTVTVKESSSIYFRALSNTYDHPATDSYPYNRKYQLTSYWEKNIKVGSDGTTQIVVPFEVTVQLDPVVITLDDVIISGTTKTFDGTDRFEGTIRATDEFMAKINGDIIFTVAYKDVNANEEVEISISAVCTDDTKVLDDSKLSGYIGRIEKKEISVVIDSKDKYYGYSLPELTYTAYGMIPGFEETVEIYVVKGEGCEHLPYELLPQTKRDETKDGYVITVVEGMTFKNYYLPEANITIGKLHIDLAPIDRLVYNKGEFTGLDTKNIATRNLEIGFTRANGNYEKLDVKFERRVYESGNDGSIREIYKLQEDMTQAPAGFYRVTISLPQFDANGGSLWSMYELDSKIATFMIKVIDASVFDKVEEEEPETPDDDKTQTDSEVVNNGSQTGIYEDNNSTNTDSTDVVIGSTNNKTKDYIAIVSIFCAVVIMIAFAIGIGRVIMKRAKR